MNLLHTMNVLGDLPKLKRKVGLAFGANFLHDFSIKMFLIILLCMGKVSMSYLFAFSRYQTKCVIKGTLMQI